MSLLLMQFYLKDDRLKFTPAGFWEIPEANLILSNKSSQLCQDVMKNIPFVLTFENRINLLKSSIDQDKLTQSRNPAHLYIQNENGELEIKNDRIVEIRRNHELEDSIYQLEGKNIKALFHVRFINALGFEEIGIDGGGITKEFLMRVVNQAFDPQLGIFIESKERTMIPNPYYFIDDLRKYEFIGRLIGKAIYEGVIIEPVLSRAFLNVILNKKNTLNELKYYDIDLYKTLHRLKYEKSDDLGITFSITEENYGALKEIELKPNGSKIDVTQADKMEFIQLYADFKLNKQMVKQCDYFRKGLSSVIDLDLFGMFNHKELQLLISGSPKLDIKDLKKHTIYNGYREDDQNILDFWFVLGNFTPQDQQQFLHFVTSCSRAPTLGFKVLDPPFCIARAGQNSQEELQRLPTAQTCFNILKLPDYRDFKILRIKLLQSIKANVGFELT